MAEEQASQERSEEPTGKRLDESRKKGQVARSRELNTFLVVVGSIAFLLWYGGTLIEQVFFMTIELLSPTDALVKDSSLLPAYLFGSIQQGMVMAIPVFVATVVLALLGPILMGGLLFSVQGLVPNAEKLDPIKGMSRIFSTNGLNELVKALLKFLLIVSFAYLLFSTLQAEMMSLARLNVVNGINKSGALIFWAALCAALSLALVSAIDIPYQIWSHNKKLMMTKQEVRDESKETDGRPEVKSKIRQLQMEASQRRMLEDIPDADVVITNPTHFSVVLKYDAEVSAAPVVVAKGRDLIALKIRLIAKEHSVPLYEEPPLARAIYGTTDIGEEVPGPLFLAVAKVLAYVFQLNRSAETDYVPRPESVPLPEEFSRYYRESE